MTIEFVFDNDNKSKTIKVNKDPNMSWEVQYWILGYNSTINTHVQIAKLKFLKPNKLTINHTNNQWIQDIWINCLKLTFNFDCEINELKESQLK